MIPPFSGRPNWPATEEAGMTAGAVSRRNLLRTAGVTAGTLLAAGLPRSRTATGNTDPYLPRRRAGLVPTGTQCSGYVPDGTAGLAAAFPLAAVELLDSPFRRHQARNTSYLLFVDPDRLLRAFRLNYGLPSTARPCGGWESPGSEVRGHNIGHLMSALALTYASTANEAAADRGRYVVDQLARCQALARSAGFHAGYLSAFPESFFDRLEAGRPVWSPYYMIHKYLAGLIDQYELAGNGGALEVAARLGDWVCWRTGRLGYARMQQVLQIEYGGIAEALANLYRVTGEDRYLIAAGRFYHAQVLDPLAAGEDQLAGLHANTTVPKIVASVRMWEETGSRRYRDASENFWGIVTRHHSYVIGGSSNHEHWHEPDVIAGQLSNRTCENCVSYNMLKLTRLLHFHQPERTDLLDHYERILFNQMLGQQDPDSPHGFSEYYYGLSPGAFKQQPMNYFPRGNPDVYSTDYDDFTCDNATAMETQAKFADTIYSRDAAGLLVNLFIPSEVTWADAGIKWRQVTGFPDQPGTRLEVVSGEAAMAVRVRIPAWVAGTSLATVNGHRAGSAARPGTWLSVSRRWRAGDRLEVALPMRLELNPTPDDPAVQAVTYGPVVLNGAYGSRQLAKMPRLDSSSLALVTSQPLTARATADGEEVALIPTARTHHQYYNVYWRT
jgi:uncharacterized protein